jgi:hypothetical protein
MCTRLFARCLLVVLLTAPAGAIAQGGQKATLLVVNRTGGSISLFDLGIHIVGERAFASDRAGRALLALDLATVATAGAIATGLDDPDGLAYSPVRVAVLER